MKHYNLSEIMKAAHNMYGTGKYRSFGDALRKSWKVAKFRLGIEARRVQTIAYFEAKNQEAEERAMFVAAFKAIQATQREKQVSVRLSNVEANTDDYNRGWCYSNFRGYCSNYCGDYKNLDL